MLNIRKKFGLSPLVSMSPGILYLSGTAMRYKSGTVSSSGLSSNEEEMRMRSLYLDKLKKTSGKDSN